MKTRLSRGGRAEPSLAGDRTRRRFAGLARAREKTEPFSHQFAVRHHREFETRRPNGRHNNPD
jgi:hypothetical protein